MDKEGVKIGVKVITIAAVILVLFFLAIIPLALLAKDGKELGNVAIIPISGAITVDGGDYLGSSTVSSEEIVQLLQEAEQNEHVQVIVLGINSPGGSAVAADEIASAVKASNKPVLALVREVAASGGYWIASATDYIIANKMSITGSIGVISSYLEFSGLLEKYGVEYQRLIAGRFKDIGTPLKPLSSDERNILQQKLNLVHDFFIQEIAENRHIPEEKVRKIADGEFFLGVEALDLGLVDQLGDQQTLDEYIQQTYGLASIQYVRYQRELSFFDYLSNILSHASFKIGQGIASLFLVKETSILLM